MVEHTLQGVTAAASTTLAGMQSGLSPSEQITSIVVSLAPEAKLSAGKKARTLIVVLAVGLILAIAIPQVFDAAASRRRARRFRRLPGGSPARTTPADSETDATIAFNHMAAAVPGRPQDSNSWQREKAEAERARKATER